MFKSFWRELLNNNQVMTQLVAIGPFRCLHGTFPCTPPETIAPCHLRCTPPLIAQSWPGGSQAAAHFHRCFVVVALVLLSLRVLIGNTPPPVNWSNDVRPGQLDVSVAFLVLTM